MQAGLLQEAAHGALTIIRTHICFTKQVSGEPPDKFPCLEINDHVFSLFVYAPAHPPTHSFLLRGKRVASITGKANSVRGPVMARVGWGNGGGGGGGGEGDGTAT